MLQQPVFVTLKTQNITYTFYALPNVAGLIARQLLEQRTNPNLNHLTFCDLFTRDFPFTSTSSLIEKLTSPVEGKFLWGFPTIFRK